jgi:hypothetical protein
MIPLISRAGHAGRLLFRRFSPLAGLFTPGLCCRQVRPETCDLLPVGIDGIQRGAVAGFPEGHQDPSAFLIDPDQHRSREGDRDLPEDRAR